MILNCCRNLDIDRFCCFPIILIVISDCIIHIHLQFDIRRYKGVYEYCRSKGIDLGKPVALDVVVDGTVPQGPTQCFSFRISFLLFIRCAMSRVCCCCYCYAGSGLSSSAAFVCSATIAIMGVLEKNFPKVLLSAK